MVLACTQHDPEGRMNTQTAKMVGKLTNIFSRIYVAVTPQTQNAQVRYLRQVKNIQVVPGGDWAKACNQLLIIYQNNQTTEPLLLSGWDKMLHWAETNPKELERAAIIKPQGLVIVGRTAKAWNSYPKSWKDTESVINSVANNAFQKDNWDWFSGNYLFHKTVIKHLINRGINNMDLVFVWPKIISDNKRKLEYRAFDGLSFEDPDRYGEEIKRLGKRRWKEVYYNSPSEWQKRAKNLTEAMDALDKVCTT